MGDTRYSGRYDRHSRSRSRSPFRKNFNERPAERDRSRRRDGSRDRSTRTRVFVSNIPFECRWMELKDLFREKVGDVSFVELFEDDKGKFIGSGIVEFKDAETAKKSVEIMDKYELRGRILKVKVDSEPDRARSRATAVRGVERERMRDGGYNDYGGSPQFDTYGLNPEFLKSLGISGPLTPKIFISNLDYKVTEKKLEEIFKLAGKLVKMELNLDNEGKSKGHATAEFEHPLEAVQAISMFSGQRLYSRVMNVRMDKFADDEPASKLPSGLHGIGKGLGVNGQPMVFSKTGMSNGGSFGLGIGGGMSGGGGGMGLGSSDMGMSSSPMGMSCGRSMGMSSGMSDRGMMNSSSMGMGMGASNMGASPIPMGMGGGGGMGGSSSMMSSGGMGSSMDSMSREPFPMSPTGPGGRGGFRDNFDRGPDNYNSSSLSDTIMLGNLPNSFTWQMLKDRFRDIGDVRYAEMKGQGTAMIRFNSVQDAQRAVDMMNGVRFDGRSIQVRLY